MVLKVKVNMPEDLTEIEDKLTDTLAEILVRRLQPKEVNRLIDLLENDDDFEIKL